jgi:hypothetical protein
MQVSEDTNKIPRTGDRERTRIFKRHKDQSDRKVFNGQKQQGHTKFLGPDGISSKICVQIC